MRELNAAVIALAGAVALAAGGILKGDTGQLALLVGYGLLIAGTTSWAITLYRSSDQK
jgi:hypothetical protein